MSEFSAATNRFSDPDLAYRKLIDAHRGLSDADSMALNARLVLILANEVGDISRLEQAIALAHAAAAPTGKAR